MWEGVERLGLATDLKESNPASAEQNASAAVSLGDVIEQEACILTCARDSCPCDAFEGLPGHIAQSQGPEGTRGPPSRRDDSI